MIAGIDVGGTQIKFGLFNDDGKLVERFTADTDTSDHGNNVIPSIVNALKKNLERLEIDKNAIKAVGMGVPCAITKNGDIESSANMGWKEPRNLSDEFEKMFGTRPFVGNDANVATMGEAWKGAAKGHQNVVMLTIGTGVGAGIICNGNLLFGAHGMAGEIGHIHVNDDEVEHCGCGGIGCLEQMSSATGIVRIARRLLKENKYNTNLNEGYMSAKTVFDEYKKGDELAREVVDIFAQYLARSLANVSMVVDPDIFVIGGGVSKAGPIMLDPIVKYYKKYTSFKQCHSNKFVLATLGNDAGIYGATYLAMNSRRDI